MYPGCTTLPVYTTLGTPRYTLLHHLLPCTSVLHGVVSEHVLGSEASQSLGELPGEGSLPRVVSLLRRLSPGCRRRKGNKRVKDWIDAGRGPA